MIELKISIEDQLGPALKNFGDARNQSRILNFILARIGRRYRVFLRKNYLGGQMINGGGGPDSLSGRILVYKKRGVKNVYTVGEKGKNTANATNVRLSNIYEHAGGYTIVPKKKKTLMFVTSDGFWHFAKKVQGKQRPFVSASFGSFGWNPVIEAEAESVFKAELAKAGLP
jgi:hypothetical protein